MNSFKTLIAASLLGTAAFAAPGLTVNGTDLQYNGKKIFFSGTNLAWSDYNSDVGASPLDENAWRKAVEGLTKRRTWSRVLKKTRSPT